MCFYCLPMSNNVHLVGVRLCVRWMPRHVNSKMKNDVYAVQEHSSLARSLSLSSSSFHFVLCATQLLRVIRRFCLFHPCLVHSTNRTIIHFANAHWTHEPKHIIHIVSGGPNFRRQLINGRILTWMRFKMYECEYWKRHKYDSLLTMRAHLCHNLLLLFSTHIHKNVLLNFYRLSSSL